MVFVSLFFFPFIIIVLFTILSSFLGRYALAFFGFKQPLWSLEWIAIQSLFCSMLITGGYAMIHTAGKTIFLMLLPLVVALFLYKLFKLKQTQQKVTQQSFLNFFVSVLAVAFFVCLLRYVAYVDQSFIVNTEHYGGDYTFYSKISYYLNKNGQENIYHYLNNLLPAVYNGSVPYHYFELWLNNLFSNLFSVHIAHSLHLITLPFLLVLILATFKGWLDNALPNAKNWYKALLIISFFFFGGLFFAAYQQSPFLSDMQNFQYSFSAFNVLKLLVPAVFLTCCFVLIQKKEPVLFLLFSLFLSMAYTPVFPAVALGSLLFLMASYFFIDRKKETVFLMGTGFLFYAALYVVTIFFTAPAVTKGLINMLSPGFIISNFTTADLKTMVNIVAGSFIKIGVLYLFPLLVLCIQLRRLWRTAKTQKIIILTAAYMSAGLLVWALFFKELNSNQLFFNLALPALNIGFIFIFIRHLSGDSNTKKWILAILGFSAVSGLVTFVNSNKSVADMQHTAFINNSIGAYERTVAKGSNKLGVVLLGEKDYTSIFHYNQTSLVGEYLFLADPESKMVSLGDYFMNLSAANKLDSLRKLNGYRMGFYYNYVNANTVTTDSADRINSFAAHRQFFKDNKIQYGIYSEHYPYADSLKPLSAISIKDSIRGYTFFTLN